MLRSSSDASGSDRLSSYKRGSIRGMQGLAPALHFHDGRASPTPSQATSIGEVSNESLQRLECQLITRFGF